MKEKQSKCFVKYISYYDPHLVGLHILQDFYDGFFSLYWFKDIYREDIF